MRVRLRYWLWMLVRSEGDERVPRVAKWGRTRPPSQFDRATTTSQRGGERFSERPGLLLVVVACSWSACRSRVRDRRHRVTRAATRRRFFRVGVVELVFSLDAQAPLSRGPNRSGERCRLTLRPLTRTCCRLRPVVRLDLPPLQGPLVQPTRPETRRRPTPLRGRARRPNSPQTTSTMPTRPSSGGTNQRRSSTLPRTTTPSET